MFKRYFILFNLILTQISFVYPNTGANSIEGDKDQIQKSRIIITGKSSVIIESKDDNTNIIVSKIETVLGGTLMRKVVQDDELSRNINEASKKATESSFGIDNGLPTEFVIEKAYPNPFNPTTRIRYGISTQTSVSIVIYDMTGRLISDYKIGEKTPGWYEFTWQGTNSHGQQVSTGIYLVTMRTEDHFQKQKVTFLKWIIL